MLFVIADCIFRYEKRSSTRQLRANKKPTDKKPKHNNASRAHLNSMMNEFQGFKRHRCYKFSRLSLYIP